MAHDRAVIVGTNAYPYLIAYWLELAKKYWLDEVDRVYVAVSQPVHQKPWPWIRKYIETIPKVELIYTDKSWPDSLDHVGRMVQADAVCLMHDDQFVFKKGVMDEYFTHAETTGEVVAPMHAIYTPGPLVEELMAKKYPGQVPVVIDESPFFSFYLNFAFVPGRLYHRTSKEFGEYIVDIGQRSDLLDWSPIYHKIASDTNFKFVLEIFNAGGHIHPIKKIEFTNYIHLPENVNSFIKDFTNGEKMFATPLPYLHLQTMAYHIGGLYWDVGEREAIEKTSGGPVARKLENEAFFADQKPWRADKIFKLALIQEFMKVIDFEGIAKYHRHTRTELDWIIDRFNFPRRTINKLQSIFHQLFMGEK
ncbi:MAG: hypothetical protein WC871_02290 [Bacteroidales bacterium]|jgi:hypothetical protein